MTYNTDDTNDDTDDDNADTESIEQLRSSFWYGSRSNLSFKFVKDLSDIEFGDFLDELLAEVGTMIDSGDPMPVIDAAYRWQIHGYTGHLGDPDDFPHRFDDVPITPLAKPLAESRVTLLTSSGHFVAGDDPKPLGVESMTQAEAEDRIGEFLKEAPTLSSIPIDVDPSDLRVRHGGYPTDAVRSDHQVGFPIGHLADLAGDGVIGALNPTAYSFVGAASHVRLKRRVAPEWAEQLRNDGKTDVVFLVPL